jgi:outer membrane lipoprotein-sorting protein
MSKRVLYLLFGPLLLISLLSGRTAGAVSASADTLEQQVRSIQDRYRVLHSLQFDFTQNTRSGGGRNRHGKGKAVFYRPDNGKPGIMRWDYTEPDVQIILNDGRELSIYTQKDRQLIVTPAADLQSDITYGFFAGTSSLLDEFSVHRADGRFVYVQQAVATRAIQLVPRKPNNQIKTLHLWFDNDFLLHHLVIEDHFDSITELDFTNIILDALPPDSPQALEQLITLDLPADTEIIRQ